MGKPKSKQLKTVSISYKRKVDNAPQVSGVAGGDGAKEMIKVAKRYGVKVMSNQKLVDKLSGVEVGNSVPENTYEELAEVFHTLEPK